jgi:hypothetical protein
VEIDGLALVQPAADYAHRGVESLGGEAAVVGQAQPMLGDAGGGEGALHRTALATLVLLVLGEVEDLPYSLPAEYADIVLIERVGADEQVVEHLGESIGAKPA